MVHAKSSQLRRGFTLTEIAIVFGIIGLILGAIWTAAAMVYHNYEVTTATKEVLAVVQNVRSLYAGQVGFSAADLAFNTNGDITCPLASAGVFPSSMIPLVPCIPSNTATYPQGPWSGSVMVVYAGTFTDGGAPDTIGANAAGKPFRFEVAFYGQSNIASVALAAQFTNLQANGLTYICDNGTWRPLPWPLANFAFTVTPSHINMDWSLQ